MGIEGDEILIAVKGKKYLLGKTYFNVGKATRVQFPVKPAYGLTIHKSQDTYENYYECY